MLQDVDLAAVFPELAKADARPGYHGAFVAKEHLLEISQKVRDELGYDLLSSVTAVDYYPEDFIEVVYHLYRTTGGGPLEFKTQVPRGKAEIPSLARLYPGAEFQEREAWDLMGVKFTDHPDMRRILLWEGFEGHPLRKDWKEPYYEEPEKPYKSRWPGGEVARSEDLVPFKDNVQFTKEFDPGGFSPESDEALYALLNRLAANDRSDPGRPAQGG